MSAVAIIPARGGSRRIPRKNIREFHGKPIIAYSIEMAKASGLFGSIWVSTEDHEIAAVAMRLGAKWYPRPRELAKDGVGTQEVIADALKTCRSAYEAPIPDHACCIYATAPMLYAADLRAGFALLPNHPYTYVSGLYYWGHANSFLRGVPLAEGYEVPFPVSRYIDINTEDEWLRAERMYAELHGIAA